MSIRLVTTLCLVLAAAGVSQVYAASIGGKYSGRYQCGDWNTVDLVITEEGADKLSAEFTFPLQQGGGTGSYSMTGQYDERAGSFLLMPQRWTRRPPPGYQMVGMEGRYDPATKRLTGKIGNFACRAFELVAEGGAPLPALPSGSAVTQGQVGNPALRAQPTVQGVEYWDASMAYMPMTDANIYYYGRARPVPVIYIRNVARANGAVLQWVFMREPGGRPPDIYVHHWNAHGFNTTAGCKAPKSSNR